MLDCIFFYLVGFLTDFSLLLNRFAKKKGHAEEMYNAKFLIFLRHACRNDEHFLRGLVGAELKKTVNYFVDVKVEKDGSVFGAGCDCTVGADGVAHCKHVIVVLLGVCEMVEKKTIKLQVTCTQELQSFHRPKKTYMGSPIKAEAMSKPKRKLSLPVDFDPRPEKLRNTGKVNERVHNTSCHLTSNMSIKQLVVPANLRAAVLDHNYSSLDYEKQFLNALKLEGISDEDVINIEKLTRGQANNKFWFEYKEFRITASNFYKVCKSYERGDQESSKRLAVSLLNPVRFTSKAVEHGIVNEPIAIKKLMELKYDKSVKAKESGLVLVKDDSFLGASPDRVIAEVTAVEAKCPYSARFDEITPSTVPYLYINSEVSLSLNENHPYFYQVQGQLAVTKRDLCEFVVYTYKDLKVIEIWKDVDFIDKMFTSLRGFYHDFFKPALLEKMFYRSYY